MEDRGIVPVSAVIIRFHNSNFLLFPWETGSLLELLTIANSVGRR